MRYTDREPGFTLAAPTFNRAVMGVLASLGQRSLSLPPLLRRIPQAKPIRLPLACR